MTIGNYLEIYSKNDCIMLKDALLNFFKALQSAGISYNVRSYTCGSIAMNHYISKYNELNLSLQKNVKAVIRNAYYGGRCEVFGNQRDGEKLLHFDFKGMYQQCMTEDLPYGDFEYQDYGFDVTQPGFYHITIEYYPDIPLLPSRANKLFFKSGVISG